MEDAMMPVAELTMGDLIEPISDDGNPIPGCADPSSIEAMLSDLQYVFASLAEELSVLKKLYAEENSARTKAEAENERLAKELDTARADISVLVSVRDELMGENEQLKKELDTTITDLCSADDARTALANETEELRKKEQSLLVDLASEHEEHVALLKQLGAAVDDLSKAQVYASVGHSLFTAMKSVARAFDDYDVYLDSRK